MRYELKEQITNWLTNSDTFFLLGAGCSACAGKPMIKELTTYVLKGTDKGLKHCFENLKADPRSLATVEDLITYLIRYRNVISMLSDKNSHDISVEKIDEWLNRIKKKIVEKVGSDWKSSPCHERFLQRVCKQSQYRSRDIFSLNYDTLLEASLDKLRISYTDGFRGTNYAWFDSDIFEESKARCRLFKLHGSTNWIYDDEYQVRRSHSIYQNGINEPVVIYPSEQKSQQIQYGIYETLMKKFRDRLRESNVNSHLVILGYSFNDDHINTAIRDAIASKNNNLTVIAFVGPEENIANQKKRLVKIFDPYVSQFNAFIGIDPKGEDHFIGKAVDPSDAKIIHEAQFWRFENLTDFMTGEKS